MTSYLDLADGRLAYDDHGGDGPLVLCLPGLGDLREEYRHLVPQLVDAGCRVVTVDLRGHGDSSAEWPSYTPDDVGRDGVALLDHLGVGRRGALVVGCSLAAASAVWVAAERPDLVRGVALIGPFVRDLPVPWWQRAVIGLMTPGVWVKYVRGLYPTGDPADLDAHLRRLRISLKKPGGMQPVKAMLRASKGPCEARIPDVTAHALVVMGTADADFDDPAEEAATVAGLLRGDVVMVEGAGHYPHAERPDQVALPVIELVEAVCHASA